jgi:hypothetical protein
MSSLNTLLGSKIHDPHHAALFRPSALRLGSPDLGRPAPAPCVRRSGHPGRVPVAINVHRFVHRYATTFIQEAPVARAVDSDAPVNAAVLPTMARLPPMVRPHLDALLRLLNFRSVPGRRQAERSKAHRRVLVARRRVTSSPDSLSGDSLGTVGRRCAGSHDTRRGAQVPPAIYRRMKAARSSPFIKPPTSTRRPPLSSCPNAHAGLCAPAMKGNETNHARLGFLHTAGAARRERLDSTTRSAR